MLNLFLDKPSISSLASLMSVCNVVYSIIGHISNERGFGVFMANRS
jgi:hypothetical protein